MKTLKIADEQKREVKILFLFYFKDKAKVSTVPPGATRNFIPTAAIPSDSISHPAMKKQVR